MHIVASARKIQLYRMAAGPPAGQEQQATIRSLLGEEITAAVHRQSVRRRGSREAQMAAPSAKSPLRPPQQGVSKERGYFPLQPDWLTTNKGPDAQVPTQLPLVAHVCQDVCVVLYSVHVRAQRGTLAFVDGLGLRGTLDAAGAGVARVGHGRERW